MSRLLATGLAIALGCGTHADEPRRAEASEVSGQLEGERGAQPRMKAVADTATLLPLRVYNFVPAADPAIFDTELDSSVVASTKSIDPSRTVLVVIDFWTGVAPQVVLNNTKALIDLARRRGIKIVHAPSGGLSNINPIVQAVDSYPDEWVAKNLEYAPFDRFLQDYGIQTVLYAGFNNGWCVFWKPLGMDRQHERTPDLDLVLLKDATLSAGAHYWTDAWANNAAEQVFSSTTIADVAAALGDLQTTVVPYTPSNLADETYGLDADFGTNLDPSRTAVVVMNSWAGHPNDGWSARLLANDRDHVAPLLDLARGAGMHVVYASDGRPLDPVVAPRGGEPVFTSKPELWRHLADHVPAEVVAAGEAPVWEFDGKSYVEIADDPALHVPELTIEASVVSRRLVPNQKVLAYHKSVGTPSYSAFQIRSGEDGRKLYYQYYAGGRWNSAVAPGFFEEAVPVDLAVTHAASGEVRIYKDGVLVTVATSGGALDYADVVALRIGARNDREHWEGSIRDVRLWGAVRDGADVQRDRELGVRGDEPGLLGAWPLDEPGGSTEVRDLSPARRQGLRVRGPYLKTLVFAGNMTNEGPVLPPIDTWGMTAYNGGASDPWDWTTSAYAARLLEDAIIAFESPESLAGEHFKKTLLSRAVATYGGTRHQITHTATLAANLPRSIRLVPLAFTARASSWVTYPRGTVHFAGAGGAGGGYVFSLDVNGSGGAVTPDGEYHAGPAGRVRDVVRVTDPSGLTATRSIAILDGVTARPATLTLPPQGTATLNATGGTGVGMTWSMEEAPSGGQVDPASGGYRAGSVGDTRDVVRVVDSLGNESRVAVTVGPGVSVTPPAAASPPRGSLSFAAQGGAGEGYRWLLATNASGGSVDPETGAYTAGRTGDVTDVLRVTDELGNVAERSITVTAAVSIAPAALPPRGSIGLSAQGGSGEGYRWALLANASGGVLDPVTGAYTAGPLGGVSDIVQVTDSLGNTAERPITVTPGISIAAAAVPPRGSVSLEAAGGSGEAYRWSLLVNASGGTLDAMTGAYTAGPTGDVSDILQVTDSLGNHAVQAITVTPGVSIAEPRPSAPGRTQVLVASGGSGQGYRWRLAGSQSGGRIDELTGAYTAGLTEQVLDQVEVTDSLGNRGTQAVQVTAALVVVLETARVPSGGAITLRAEGGTGRGYRWSLIAGSSRGVVSPDGIYRAGGVGRDVVAVEDSAGNVATGELVVVEGARGAGSGCGSTGDGTSGMAFLALGAAALLRRPRRRNGAEA